MGPASCWEGPVYFTRDLMHAGRGLCIIGGAQHMLGGACYYGIVLLHAGYSVWSQGPDEFWQGPSACWEETFLWEGSGECRKRSAYYWRGMVHAGKGPDAF